MGRFRVYIKPFGDDGEYQDDWTEVTEDIDSTGIGAMKQSLDNTEYDIGIFKNSNVTLTLINLSGRYSDVGAPGSIFRFRRSNSQVRITWEINPGGLKCGFFECGNVKLGTEEVAFEGLLDDRALKQEADDQNISFTVLGKESIFDEVLVPFADIAAGDTFEELIFTLLNQTAITDLLTVNVGNIDCSVNSVTDTIADLENKTVKEALSAILLYSNSVLYVLNNVVFVSPRTATASIQKTFYGQGAMSGIENIIDISDYRIGLNRLYNYFTWRDTTIFSQDVTSVQRYGIRKREVDTDLVTDTAKRQAILDSLKNEFANLKREMKLKVPLDYDTLALEVLDRIVIDYPNVAVAAGSEVPLWDLATWDSAVFPYEMLPIAIETSANFKILSKDIDTSNHEIVFYVREI